MPYITIDPYYDNAFYNESKEALKNNNTKFSTFIEIKPPYNWYFNLEESPNMLNYDEISKSEQRWLVSIINTLRPNEEYVFLRRNNDNGPKALLKFIENTPLKAARLSDYAVFFTVKNREEVESLSKILPGKIWYMGKYYNNKFRVCLYTHNAIKNLIPEEQILLEKNKQLQEPGRFEAELNWKVFRGNDSLVKFTETPYFEKGSMHRVKIQGEHSGRFII